MWIYLLRRIMQALPVVIGVALISFLLTEMSGNAVRQLMGQATTPEAVKRIEAQYGFDKPRSERFVNYMTRLAHGDLGTSIARQGQSVTEIITNGMRVTIKIALGAILLASALGVMMGALAAWKPYSIVDYAASLFASLGVSIPAFFFAMVMLLIFSVKLQWLPIGGYEPGKPQFLILPCLTLGLLTTASISRLARNCLLEGMAQDYTRTARAKGLKRYAALLYHALPNALVPVVTIIGGDFGALLSGAVLTETVYGLPGMGSVIRDAIFSRDLPVVMGCCLVFALVFVTVNLLVDVSYAFLDPRIRHGE